MKKCQNFLVKSHIVRYLKLIVFMAGMVTTVKSMQKNGLKARLRTMTERERLIELLSKKMSNEIAIKIVADYLLENGVIVPLCKVGDTIYEIISPKGKEPYFITAVVCAVHIADSTRNHCNHKRTSYIVAECPNTKYVCKYVFSKFGKTVFTTREAAEKALAERKKQPNCNTCSYIETTEKGLYCCYFNGATQNENDWCYHYKEREENA